MSTRSTPLSRRLLEGAVLLLSGALPAGAAAAGAEQVVGGIDAVVFVCTPLDAKSVRPGLEMLQRAAEQRKLDLPAIRQTEAYRTTYNAEVNRMLSLPAKDRLAACQRAW